MLLAHANRCLSEEPFYVFQVQRAGRLTHTQSHAIAHGQANIQTHSSSSSSGPKRVSAKIKSNERVLCNVTTLPEPKYKKKIHRHRILSQHSIQLNGQTLNHTIQCHHFSPRTVVNGNVFSTIQVRLKSLIYYICLVAERVNGIFAAFSTIY